MSNAPSDKSSQGKKKKTPSPKQPVKEVTDKRSEQSLKIAKSKPPAVIPEEIINASTEQIIVKTRFMDAEIRIMQNQEIQLRHDFETMDDKKKVRN